MASNGTIAHRFANKDFGKFGTLKGSSTHVEGRSYYSYSTKFAQWVDMEKNVCVVFEGSTSPTSSKHKIGKSCFPDEVVVLPYNDHRGGWYSWNGCDLGIWGDHTWELSHRWKLIDYYVAQMYDALETIKGGKKKNLDFFASNALVEYAPLIEKVCELYKDTSIPKYLKRKDVKKEWKTLVRALFKDNVRDVPTLVDMLFGKGTWQAYYDYCARYRNASVKKSQMIALCRRLGIANPYERWQGDEVWKHDMSADQIRKLSAKERLELHWLALTKKEIYAHKEETERKYDKNNFNAYKWIVGHEPKRASRWNLSWSNTVEEVTNMFTGELYIVKEKKYRSYYRLHGLKYDVYFDYDGFRMSGDKEEWIRNFYAECKEIDHNLRALEIFDRFGESVYTDQEIDIFTYRIYVLNDMVREGTSEEEYALCEEFVERWNTILRDKEARCRAERIERERRKEEERKEKELQEKIKQEQIDECLSRGLEGCRDLWRKHYMPIYRAESYNDNQDDKAFFFGGNVLLRFNLGKDVVETSKDIRLNIPTCKKMFALVKVWHEHPEKFRRMDVKTLSGTYTISDYEHDVMTAGCHKFAYEEMERMYNEIIANESGVC